MTYTEIKDLLNAGFSKDEIMKLTNSGDSPISPDPASAAAEKEAPTAAAAEDKSPVAGEEKTEDNKDSASPSPKQETDSAMEDIKKQLQQLATDNQELRKMIQSNNIRDRTIDTFQPDILSQAEAALGALINPDYSKEGGT